MRIKALAITAISVLAVGAASTASAADLPVKAMPPAVAVYSWTGFYVGGNIGAAWVKDEQVQTPANAATTTFWGPCFAAGACPRNFGSNSDVGLILGGQIGYNWQIQNWVVGLEADLQWSGADATNSVVLANTGTGFAAFAGSSTTDLRWFGTVRGRLGVLFSPNLLVYATGGLAYGNVQRSWTSGFGTAAQVVTGASSRTDWGWTLGFGAEWLLAPRWTLGAEYLFVRLDGDTYTAASTTGGCAATNCQFTITSSDLDVHIARLKLNYKLN